MTKDESLTRMAGALAAVARMDQDFDPNSLTAQEWEQIRPLLVADQQSRFAEQGKRIAIFGYLVKHAPAAHSVSTAIEQLSVEDLRTFREILERDVQDFEDWGVVESYLDG